MPRRSPDDNLADEDFPGINRAYYAAEPADYFQERFDNLLITAGARDARAAVIRKGGEFGGVKFGEATGARCGGSGKIGRALRPRRELVEEVRAVGR